MLLKFIVEVAFGHVNERLKRNQ